MAKYKVNYNVEFENALAHYLNQGYQMVRKVIYDPVSSLFKTDRSKKSWVEIYFCPHRDECPAFKNGECVCYNLGILHRCPYAKKYYKEGVTKRSSNYYSFINSAKLVFDTEYEKIGKKISGLYHISLLGDKKVVFLPLSHLNNYVNPILNELHMEKEEFIATEHFTPENINKLLNFHPEALFGGEITTYQKEEIPKFVRDLKIYFPELFNECVKGTRFEEKIETINHVGRKALVKTLLPGKVKISIHIWNWDGEKLTATASVLNSVGLNNEPLTMIPNDNTVVTVVDNATVGENSIVKEF